MSRKVVIKSSASHKSVQVPKMAAKHNPIQVPRQPKKVTISIKKK